MKKKFITPLMGAVLVLSMALAGCGNNAAQSSPNPSTEVSSTTLQTVFAGGIGTVEDPYQVADAEQLDAVRKDLTASYILIADIDMRGVSFASIGTFEPKTAAEEDAETPKETSAFRGHFDGDGHTISNLTIAESEKNGVGLFGCVIGGGAGVENLKLNNITVEGGNMTGGVVGFGLCDTVIKGVELTGTNKVTGTLLVGGLIGAAQCDIVDCKATAEVVLSAEDAQAAGIVVGGLEDGNVENCYASGSVTAGNGCFSVGGLAGCFHNSAYAKNCVAENIAISVGENSWLIGGLAGHAGTPEGSSTAITGCTVKNVTINAAETAERIGGIVGGGFYGSNFKQFFAEPTAAAISDCTVSDTAVIGGKLVGSVLGYAYSNSAVQNCTSAFTWNGNQLDKQIGGDVTLPLDQLC